MKKKCLLGTVLLAGSLLAVQPALGQCADLSLEEAIQIALVNNPDVNITRLGEETAKAKITQARGSNSFSWKASTSFGTSEVDTYGWDTSNSTRRMTPIVLLVCDSCIVLQYSPKELSADSSLKSWV